MAPMATLGKQNREGPSYKSRPAFLGEEPTADHYGRVTDAANRHTSSLRLSKTWIQTYISTGDIPRSSLFEESFNIKIIQ